MPCTITAHSCDGNTSGSRKLSTSCRVFSCWSVIAESRAEYPWLQSEVVAATTKGDRRTVRQRRDRHLDPGSPVEVNSDGDQAQAARVLALEQIARRLAVAVDVVWRARTSTRMHQYEKSATRARHSLHALLMILVQIWLCWASGIPMITFVDPQRRNVACECRRWKNRA